MHYSEATTLIDFRLWQIYFVDKVNYDTVEEIQHFKEFNIIINLNLNISSLYDTLLGSEIKGHGKWN